MAENTENSGDFFDDLADSFWACFPQETAESFAQCKKDTLTWIKSTVSSYVDHEINVTDQRLKNAQRIREEWCRESEPPAADSSQPA